MNTPEDYINDAQRLLNSAPHEASPTLRMDRLNAALTSATIGAAMYLAEVASAIRDIAESADELAGIRRPERPLPDSFEPDAIDRAWDNRKDDRPEEDGS